MSRVVVFTLPLLAACGRTYESIDEACKDNVRGDADASDAAIEIVRRISCYRKFAGIDRGSLDKRVTEAAESHGFYLSENPEQLEAGWGLESGGQNGFSGADVYQRLDAAGYFGETGGSALVWEVLGYVQPDLTPTEVVDEDIHNPFLRDVYLSPSWEAAGYTEFVVEVPESTAADAPEVEVTLSYMNVVLYYPSGARANSPVVYPVDGQTGVPTSWENPYFGYDPLLAEIPAVSGYPISFTCGSSTVVGGENPLAVKVRSSKIIGPDGPVEHTITLPGSYTFGSTNSTATLFPLEPLEPDTTYTVEVSLSWVDRDKDITTTFTTGGEAVATSSTPQARMRPPG